jgi:hypothetical protein
MSEAGHISNARLYKRKGRGHSPEISILRERNAVPKGEQFTWATASMKASPAWRAMPLVARQIVDRIELEHCSHAGRENGRLPVTYEDFAKYGVRRNSIRDGIRIAEALGWIDVVHRGHRGAADVRMAARYALTWVDRYDGAPRSNRWKRFQTDKDAKEEVENIRPRRRTKRTTRPVLVEDVA